MGDALGKVHTMDEAAAALRISRRALHDIVKRHPFYFLNGSRKLFTASDLVKLTEALRPDPTPCRSSSSRPARGSRQTIESGAPTLASAWTKAQAALSKPSRGSSSQRGKPRSNVLSLPQR